MEKRKIYNVTSIKDCKRLLDSIPLFSITLTKFNPSIIEDSLFENCESLENVVGTFDTKVIGKRAFAHCTNLKRFDASIEDTKEEAFAFCNSLLDFNFSAMKNLSEKSFYFSGLKTIELPNTIDAIPEYCFSGCINLENIGFNRVALIKDFAFSNCLQLRYIILEENIKEIGKGAFEGCILLNTIYCVSDTPPKIYKNTFNQCNIKKILVKNKKALDNYSRAPYWKNYKDIIFIKD